MPWTEKDPKSANGTHSATNERAQLLSKTKEEFLPIAAKEASSGDKGIQTVEFQPVKSPGTYEAEFAVKGEDVIFHFWPWGYHDAERRGETLPRFKKGFQASLAKAMSEAFDSKRVEIQDDPDMGAIFVKASGFGTNQFFRKLSIDACERLHKSFES